MQLPSSLPIAIAYNLARFDPIEGFQLRIYDFCPNRLAERLDQTVADGLHSPAALSGLRHLQRQIICPAVRITIADDGVLLIQP